MGNGAGAVVVQLFIIVRANIPAGENIFQMLEEGRIHRHHIFKPAVDRAFLHHQNLAIALDNLRLDLAQFLVEKDLVREFTIHDLLANLRDATGAQGIRLARPAQLGLHFLVALEQRFFRPLGREGRVRFDLIDFIENGPGRSGGHSDNFFGVFDWLGHRWISDP